MGRFEHHLPAPSSTANCLFSCLYAPWWNWFKCKADEYLYWLSVTDWIHNLKRTLGAAPYFREQSITCFPAYLSLVMNKEIY